MEIEEINTYRQRLEKEYLELLSLRKSILAQVEMDKNDAEIAKRNKEVILGTNADLIGEASNVLDDFKKQKEDFVRGLEARDIELADKKKLLDKMEAELKIRADVAESAKKNYEVLINENKEKEKTLQDKIKEIDDARKNMEGQEKDAKAILELNQQDRERAKKESEDLRESVSVFQKEKEELALEKEAVQKQIETIHREKEFINNDRLHLYSQQQALKYAWEETKRKLEEVKKIKSMVK